MRKREVSLLVVGMCSHGSALRVLNIVSEPEFLYIIIEFVFSIDFNLIEVLVLDKLLEDGPNFLKSLIYICAIQLYQM